MWPDIIINNTKSHCMKPTCTWITLCIKITVMLEHLKNVCKEKGLPQLTWGFSPVCAWTGNLRAWIDDKDLRHILHWNGVSCLCVFKGCCKSVFLANVFPHWLNLKFFIPLCRIRCVLRFDWWETDFLQKLHAKDFSFAWALMWQLSPDFVLNVFLHNLQM